MSSDIKLSYGSGSGSGYGSGSGSGSGDGSSYGYGYDSGSGYGDGSGYGSGYGDGSGYGNGSGSFVAFGRGYKLTRLDMTTSHDFLWQVGANKAPGPLLPGDYECPNAPGDGLCIGWTVAGLTSGGLKFDPKVSRLWLAEIAAADTLGGFEDKTRAAVVTLVREATPEEWSEVKP